MKKTSKFDEITAIGNLAVKSARKENWANGLPNVESCNGKVCYRLANGKILKKYDWDK